MSKPAAKSTEVFLPKVPRVWPSGDADQGEEGDEVYYPVEAIQSVFRYRTSKGRRDFILYGTWWYGFCEASWETLEDADEHTQELIKNVWEAIGIQGLDDLPPMKEVRCPEEFVIQTSQNSRRFFKANGIEPPKGSDRLYL
ncbi:uncharacterized protein SCHCODRAFT_02495217 [Schizophyllum commune H4-8]|nr:uncharacterized protein SCHCODRAFT_02495217 [Schizophyllum commune H4-8]KAI5894718.1 hypothetical protein SCHCODRAFT_02495217 [Schizophyllum commune H4-8]